MARDFSDRVEDEYKKMATVPPSWKNAVEWAKRKASNLHGSANFNAEDGDMDYVHASFDSELGAKKFADMAEATGYFRKCLIHGPGKDLVACYFK